LITGGLGFIGSNLARQLLADVHQAKLLESMIAEYGGNLANIADIHDQVRDDISEVRNPFAMR
jgi:UDP-glucose 4-epimerase